MNKQEVVKYLEKKREAALDNSEYYRDKENEKYEKMNRVRVNRYTIAIQAVEQIDEPQAENVEVPGFVGNWYESNKHKLERAIIDVACSMEKGEFPFNLPFEDWFIYPGNHPIETLIKMKLNGYTVKSKRWVVKFEREGKPCYFSEWLYTYMLRGTGCWDKSHKDVYIFTDKSKAEAVATLVEGSVEEID